MVKLSSLFGQIHSEIFSAVNFENLVAQSGAERHTKGFLSKTQLIAMLFCHLAGSGFSKGDSQWSGLLQREARTSRDQESSHEIDSLLRK